jgi:hypothetical protein
MLQQLSGISLARFPRRIVRDLPARVTLKILIGLEIFVCDFQAGVRKVQFSRIAVVRSRTVKLKLRILYNGTVHFSSSIY